MVVRIYNEVDTMEPVQIIGIILGTLAILKIVKQVKRSSITPFVAFSWIFFGMLVLLMIVFPDYLAYPAQLLGIGRGIDVLVYFGIIVLFFAFYKTYLRTEHLEREITTIISEIAINERHDKKLKGGKNDK